MYLRKKKKQNTFILSVPIASVYITRITRLGQRKLSRLRELQSLVASLENRTSHRWMNRKDDLVGDNLDDRFLLDDPRVWGGVENVYLLILFMEFWSLCWSGRLVFWDFSRGIFRQLVMMAPTCSRHTSGRYVRCGSGDNLCPEKSLCL